MAYDKRFRERAVAFKESGATFKELKEVFGIDHKTCAAWVKLKSETGSIVTDKSHNPRKRKIDAEKLKQAVEEKPDAYLEELAKPFGCTPQAVFCALKKLKITYKKRRSLTRKNPKTSDRSSFPK
jgi:transposase